MKKNCTLVAFLYLLTTILILYPLLSNAAGEKETLKIGIHNFPTYLNPLYAMDETSQSVLNKIFDALFYFDGAGKLQKGLVQTYRTGNNNKEIILTLKKGIFFSNGQELDAHDVKATLERIKDSRFQSPYVSKLAFINQVEKKDKYTLKLTLHYPLAAWKSHLSLKILNADEIAPAKPENFRHTTLSGTGPYQIHQVKEPSKIVLKLKDPLQNPSMYRFIEYVVVAYTQLAPLKLINNEIDICELQPENKEVYQHSNQWKENFSILEYKKFGYTYLVFNLENAKLNRDVRRLFYNLLIHGDFPERFLNGKGERVFTPFLLLNNKVNREKLPVQPLEKPLHLKILVNSESRVRKEFVLFLGMELKRFNIHLSPLFLEYHTFLRYIKKSAYDVAVSGFLLDIDYDMKDIFSSDAYFNYANFKHPEMDRLLDNGLKEPDPVKREAIYLKAHKIWLEELPLIPLFNLYYYVGVSKRIRIPETVSTLVSAEGDFLINIKQWTKK